MTEDPSRTSSPHNDTGLLGSGPPTATQTQEGYLANHIPQGTLVERDTTNRRDQGTQTSSVHCLTFSPGLCAELIRDHKLNEAQLRNELVRILDDDAALKERDSLKKLENALEKHVTSKIATDSHDLSCRISELTSSFSRHVEEANSRMVELKRSLEHATKLITGAQLSDDHLSDELLDSRAVHSPSAPDTSGTKPTKSAGTSPVLPYHIFPGNPFASFSVEQLDTCTEYDSTFNNRKVAYYGTLPYKYTGGSHKPRDISSNPYLEQISKKLEELFPDCPAFNSFMVTKYDSHQSCIPPHSDDEDSIEPDSIIATISLGSSRPVIFRRKPPGKYEKTSLTLEHGSLYGMTRASQDIFDHCIPRVEPAEYTGIRLSITCRLLRQSPAPSPGHRMQNSENTTSRPKRVLILSDSKNASFDCSIFHEPVIAFRRNLFFLRDLNEHARSIEQADVVLISAGINDLRKIKAADPVTLHDHIKHFVSQHKTQFIFDSITPLSMNADRFNNMNRRIDHLNELLLQLSLRSPNFKLFDNLKFGLPHLARDGIHLNMAGKSSMTDCWVHCVLLTVGLRRGTLPLRRRYANLVDAFYSQPK